MPAVVAAMTGVRGVICFGHGRQVVVLVLTHGMVSWFVHGVIHHVMFRMVRHCVLFMIVHCYLDFTGWNLWNHREMYLEICLSIQTGFLTVFLTLGKIGIIAYFPSYSVIHSSGDVHG